MCGIHTLIQQDNLLRMIYTLQLVNIKNCTFKALPIEVLRYVTLSSCCSQSVYKGPSINVNIFMSVQTIHFLRPSPQKKEYASTFFEWQKSP